LTGRLDDPKFKLAPLIMQVFMNVFTKAMTKPFAMLGSMFGGGEDLEHVAFDPGSTDFAAGQSAKLDTLTAALYERPALRLAITGSVDPVKDREALAKLKLERKLGELRVKELQAAGQKVTSVDSIRLAPEDRDRLVKLAYAEAMGLVSSKASGARAATVVAHLMTRTNFEPLRAVKVANAGKGAPAGEVVSVADMEKKLIEIAEITPQDYQKLMGDRAAAVQSYLLQSGKVETNRIAIAASKTVDASFQGSTRVDLTLQ
jgi:urease gamma subunit